MMASAISGIREQFPSAVVVYRYLKGGESGEKDMRNHQELIHYRFIGTSMNSSDLHSVLRGVCTQIHVAYSLTPAIPSSTKDLIVLFQVLSHTHH